MRIKHINAKSGSKFWAQLECERCGYIRKNVECTHAQWFYENMLPAMICPDCGESRNTMPTEYLQPGGAWQAYHGNK